MTQPLMNCLLGSVGETSVLYEQCKWVSCSMGFNECLRWQISGQGFSPSPSLPLLSHSTLQLSPPLLFDNRFKPELKQTFWQANVLSSIHFLIATLLPSSTTQWKRSKLGNKIHFTNSSLYRPFPPLPSLTPKQEFSLELCLTRIPYFKFTA